MTVVERCEKEEDMRRDGCVYQEIEVAICMGDGVEWRVKWKVFAGGERN